MNPFQKVLDAFRKALAANPRIVRSQNGRSASAHGRDFKRCKRAATVRRNKQKYRTKNDSRALRKARRAAQ